MRLLTAAILLGMASMRPSEKMVASKSVSSTSTVSMHAEVFHAGFIQHDGVGRAFVVFGGSGDAGQRQAEE